MSKRERTESKGGCFCCRDNIRVRCEVNIPKIDRPEYFTIRAFSNNIEGAELCLLLYKLFRLCSIYVCWTFEQLKEDIHTYKSSTPFSYTNTDKCLFSTLFKDIKPHCELHLTFYHLQEIILFEDFNINIKFN